MINLAFKKGKRIKVVVKLCCKALCLLPRTVLQLLLACRAAHLSCHFLWGGSEFAGTLLLEKRELSPGKTPAKSDSRLQL